ncbi:hypothetical protein EDB85DRAFT_1897364 [Lactarius pseudohatsudake]|nr:hypothetical protein EDB85DRAFT_1897364 [Lactarius pseudohatsudake]
MDERWGCGDDSDVSDGGDKWAGVGIGGGCKCAGSKSAGGSEPAGKGMGGRGNGLGVMSDSSRKCAGRGVDGEGAGNELGSESERTDEGKVLCGENTWDELDDAMIGRVEVEEVGIISFCQSQGELRRSINSQMIHLGEAVHWPVVIVLGRCGDVVGIGGICVA